MGQCFHRNQPDVSHCITHCRRMRWRRNLSGSLCDHTIQIDCSPLGREDALKYHHTSVVERLLRGEQWSDDRGPLVSPVIRHRADHHRGDPGRRIRCRCVLWAWYRPQDDGSGDCETASAPVVDDLPGRRRLRREHLHPRQRRLAVASDILLISVYCGTPGASISAMRPGLRILSAAIQVSDCSMSLRPVSPPWRRP